ncbi:hypothetical protein L2E82_39602 [Cichorium intybus]|uniref:Uncharacterized protein n=1 Tax=Cichorium intybus TaxID=13427 RepID=A0ACB9AIH5_CICIN|nr:hypothetical protein L2E82_39602 [Cichorium intybus]
MNIISSVITHIAKAITGIALSSGSNKFFCGSKDKSLRVWDCNSGEHLGVLCLIGIQAPVLPRYPASLSVTLYSYLLVLCLCALCCPKKMADGEKDLPRDAKIVKTLLKSMGDDHYEPRVLQQFL